MDDCEPRVRHRGFFLHSDTTGEPDTGEHENPEGFVVRARDGRRRARARQFASSAPREMQGRRLDEGRSRTEEVGIADEGRPEIRSGSVTGSRQRAH
jgi:hypothetical protein